MPQSNRPPTPVSGSAAVGPTRDLKAGEIVGGNYKIKSVLGRGGMGVVYQAEHLGIHRDVALKMLAPDRINENNWKRFLAEGKAIARLEHPNIVKVYDMGTDGPDCLYYVMDLLRGMSLAQYIDKNDLPDLDQILEIFGQLCAGLGYAHKHGLVHRDIKPSNIFICPAGGGSKVPVVKIIDYGLVKLVGEEDRLKQSHTTAGHVCGSPLYMSPEQCMAGKIDSRSDIYSLGCTLFECLTGETPFTGETGLATAMMHQNARPPSLSDVRPEKNYPENLEQLVARMLEKSPTQRYQSAAQINQDILRIKAGKSIERGPVFLQGPLYQLDTSQEEELEAPHRKTSLPIAWICALAAVATSFAAWAAISYLSARNEDQTVNNILVGTSTHPGIITGVKETPEMLKARQVFADCPQISNGLVVRSEIPMRVFNFPEVPLGFVCWGPEGRFRQLAKGEVIAPADAIVTLQLLRPEGEYARMFPSILAKIGPEDITGLEVREPAGSGDGSVLSYELSAELIQAVSKWKSLRMLDFYRCRVPDKTILALNCFATMESLKLRDALVDGQALSQVRWVAKLKVLDVKGIKNVDPVLRALTGASSLKMLDLSLTMPTVNGLKALPSCRHLESLSFDDADMNDSELSVVCDIASLHYLSLGGCNITGKSVDSLARLKGLRFLSLMQVNMDKDDVERLSRLLPTCSIRYEKVRTQTINDYCKDGRLPKDDTAGGAWMFKAGRAERFRP